MLALRRGAGEQPVVADAMETLGQDVEQEAPDELVGAERHCAIPRLPVAAVILVAEGHAALVESDEPAVRDGDAMGVAGEIGEHRFGPGEGRLGVDEPVLPLAAARDARRRRLGAAGPRSRQRTRAGPPRGRRRAPVRKSRRNRRESTRTGSRKPGRQRTQRVPSSDIPPPGTIIWTCGWWVIAEPQLWSTAVAPMRAPRCLGIGGDREQRLGRRAEQQVVDHRLVLVSDGADLGRQREDEVEIADRQQIGRAGGEPVPRRRCALASCGQWRLRHELYAIRLWPQSSQRSTCPPSAAERHFSIADITWSCPGSHARHWLGASRPHGDERCLRPPASGGARPPATPRVAVSRRSRVRAGRAGW